MKTRVYLQVKLDDDEVLGEAVNHKHEGRIAVHTFDHNVAIRADGVRGHAKLTLMKKLDSFSPRLTRALCQGEKFPQVRIDWFHIDAQGGETLFFRHLLEETRIVKIQLRFDTDDDDGIPLEEIDLRYQKITWSHMPTQNATDDIWVESASD